MMTSLGFKRESKYLKQKRMDGARQWCYVMSYDELYALFDKKGWIHSRDREDYGIDNEAENCLLLFQSQSLSPSQSLKKLRH